MQKEYDIAAFDCIHAYTLFTDGNCAMHLAEKHNIPFVVAVRNTDVNTFFKYMPHLRKRGIEIMRKAARVFFLSEAYKKQVFEKYIPCKYHEEIAKKTLVIPNGIDDFWFGSNADVSHTDRGDTIKLIYAGRIDENKNIPTTQRAVQILNDKGYSVRLTVVGRIIDQKEFARIQNCPNTTYIDAAHNTYIDILYYLGLIGGALLMVILVQLTNMLPKPRSRNLLNYSVVGTILIMYVFLSQLFYFDLAFQIMLAIIVLRLDITKRRDRNAGSEEVFRSNYL